MIIVNQMFFSSWQNSIQLKLKISLQWETVKMIYVWSGKAVLVLLFAHIISFLNLVADIIINEKSFNKVLEIALYI